MTIHRQKWTPDQLAVLSARYPNERTDKLAASIGRTVSATHQRANQLGLRKSAEYLATPDAGRKDGNRGGKARFKKGQIPWNKGMKGLDIGGKETRFKVGSKPQKWKPIGAERICKDGLLVRKYFDTGVKSIDWVAVHVYVWTQHNGPVPAGHAVVFVDGNNRNFDPENLECVTRAELMRRNSVHNLPKELAELCQLRGALNRQINKRASK